MDNLGSLGMLPELTDREIAYGFPIGSAESEIRKGQPLRRRRPQSSPIEILDRILMEALSKTPCVIAFSGGRDSSLLLARAAMVAKKHGLPRPVALTHRYPAEDTDAQETEWQNRVIDHLRLLDLPLEWVINDVSTEFDILGKPLTNLLAANGRPFYPPASGSTLFDCKFASGGSVVTGEFGDELFGSSRSYRFRRAVSAFRLSEPKTIKGVVRPLLRTMRAVDVDEITQLTGVSWLTTEERALFLQDTKRAVDDSFGWRGEVRRKLTLRNLDVFVETRDRIAELFDCLAVDPFLDYKFIESWLDWVGYFGMSRETAMSVLSDGLLPESVITRRGKAFFNRSRFGDETRKFLANWNGDGTSNPHVDAELMQAVWTQKLVPLQSALLLQQAWLASRRGIEVQ
ncbi:asparagine synthase-related protein [Rhodococcus cerastii]|uniref:Asparagine synthase-related protein n=1 Tax=Rhodococcus cerastii TaxID=908616 RepID=A0ABU4D3Y9_9NOCA|nr:asparagine synthase-related protein [Rhodococcus cerastii]MDV6304439.1 asparagine synthase-related protein [Rhodococcus cerastii]